MTAPPERREPIPYSYASSKTAVLHDLLTDVPTPHLRLSLHNHLLFVHWQAVSSSCLPSWRASSSQHRPSASLTKGTRAVPRPPATTPRAGDSFETCPLLPYRPSVRADKRKEGYWAPADLAPASTIFRLVTSTIALNDRAPTGPRRLSQCFCHSSAAPRVLDHRMSAS